MTLRAAAVLILVLFRSIPAAAQDAGAPPTDAIRKRDGDSGSPLKGMSSEGVSSGRSNLLDRASASVSVLSGDDLKTLGVQSVIDALRLMPGLEVEKISASESAVSVRGYVGPAAASQGMLALVDGRQAYNEFFGAPFWETLPICMDEIKSIEVIRGPGSFLYGPNAMHGLVNITTLSPLDYGDESFASHQTFLTMAGGTYAANQESLIYVKRDGETAMKVSLAHDDMDQFEGRGDTKNKLFGSIRVQSRPGQGHELDLTAGMSRQKFDVLFPETTLLDPATYTTRATEYYIQGKYILVESLTLRVSWTRFLADGQPDAVFLPFSLLLDTGDADLQYSFSPWRSQNFTVGTGLRYSTFNTDHQDISNGRHATQVEWLFIQDEMTLASDLFLTAGVRLDDHSTAGLSIAPRLALVYEFEPPKTVEIDGKQTLAPGQSLRATAGYGFRNPAHRELQFDMQVLTKLPGPFQPSTVVGNQDLDPEEMRSFEIGYWGRPTSSLQAECSVFYNLGDHLVVFDAVPPPPSVATLTAIQRQNRNKEDAYGIEANVEYQLTRQAFVFGNYAYELRHNRVTHNRIPDGPLNKVNAGVRYQEDRSLSGMVWLNFFDEITFTDKTTGNHVGHVPAYGLLNVKIWQPFKMGSADGKFFVQAFNATNHVHREHPDGQEYGLIGMAGLELAW